MLALPLQSVGAMASVLRQQVIILSRKSRSRVRLRNIDRLIFVWLYRFFPAILNAITVVKPETIIRWHRSGARTYRAIARPQAQLSGVELDAKKFVIKR